MQTLLVGNGINIQYGGPENLNKAIILRAINNVQKNKIPRHVMVDEPDLLLAVFGNLFREIRYVLKGEYDQFAFTNSEKYSLYDFISNYESEKSLNITSIGFEDYFLIVDLLLRKLNIQNPDAYITKETFKRFFIHAIYNEGRVNSIYEKYPVGLWDFLSGFGKLFTTNYDRNIEMFTGRKVYYLHGAFHIKGDVYDENSLRNYMQDRPLDDIEVDEDYPHLYSNVLTSYNGNNKLFVLTKGLYANQALEKLVYAYTTQEGIRRDINSWAKEKSGPVKKLHESIKLKTNNPQLAFTESYPINEFKGINGDLTILGLAPNNDTHIFELINNNDNIMRVTYYFYSDKQNEKIKDMLCNRQLEFIDVKILWERCK